MREILRPRANERSRPSGVERLQNFSALVSGLNFDTTTLEEAEEWGNAMLYAVDAWKRKARGGRHG